MQHYVINLNGYNINTVLVEGSCYVSCPDVMPYFGYTPTAFHQQTGIGNAKRKLLYTEKVVNKWWYDKYAIQSLVRYSKKNKPVIEAKVEGLVNKMKEIEQGWNKEVIEEKETVFVHSVKSVVDGVVTLTDGSERKPKLEFKVATTNSINGMKSRGNKAECDISGTPIKAGDEICTFRLYDNDSKQSFKVLAKYVQQDKQEGEEHQTTKESEECSKSLPSKIMEWEGVFVWILIAGLTVSHLIR